MKETTIKTLVIVVDVRVGKKIQSFPGHDLPKWI